MKRLPIILLAITVAALGVLTTSSTASAAPPSCGPGSHWIDGCTGGVPDPFPDNFPNSGAVVGVDFDGDCAVDQTFVLVGPTTVDRESATVNSTHFPLASPPGGHVPDDAVPDVIDIEIVSMSLTGGGITLRAGDTSGAPLLQESNGTIVEQTLDDTKADSWFNVNFEVGGPALPFPIYNHTPLVIQSEIEKVPPVATYLHPAGCVPLFKEVPPAPPVTWMANLVTAQHSPVIPVGGIAGVRGGDGSPPAAAQPDGSSFPYAAVAGAAAAALAAAAGGGWYVRRRLR